MKAGDVCDDLCVAYDPFVTLALVALLLSKMLYTDYDIIH